MRKPTGIRAVLIVALAVLIAMLASLLLATLTIARTTSHPRLKLDGKVVVTDPQPVLRRGWTYVPITFFQKIGLIVEWKPGSSTGAIAWPDSDCIYDLTAGQSWVPGQVKGSHVKIPAAPFMLSGYLMVPLRTPTADWVDPGNTPGRPIDIQWDQESLTASVYQSKSWLKEQRERELEREKSEAGGKTPVI